MTDYIEKNSVIDLIDNAIRNCKWYVAECAIDEDDRNLKVLREKVQSIPAAEVAPVVRAENIANAHPSDEFECSKCGTYLADYIELRRVDGTDDSYIYEFTDWNYCPKCGARMGGEENG